MFYSAKYRLLAIGIPKTGSISVEKALYEVDPTGENHSLTIDDKTYRGSDFQQGILGHARAKEIKALIGKEQFDKLRTIAIIRNPYARLVSAYFFNKQVSPWNFKNVIGSKKLLIRKVKFFVTTFSTKILPFWLWALLYPYKSSYDYVYDDSGERLVTYLGRTEHLQEDLVLILKDKCESRAKWYRFEL